MLDENWTGRTTKPSAHLYPHQWSWDSAFIAIGNAARDNVADALTELRSLFEAQWSTGMVPHMVFDQAATGYYPSAELWGTRGISAMPAAVLTSGMCQPPVHASAVWQVGQHLESRDRYDLFAEFFEPLCAWHDYLHSTRAVGSPLLEIWHPWESGMDNSPLWDTVFSRLHPNDEDIPEYRRVDTDHADASERPTAEQYDRYVYLLELLRREDYQPSDPTTLPFRVCDVLFNSIAASADADLARIAEVLDLPTQDLTGRSQALTEAVVTEMWSDELGQFVDLDRTTATPIAVAVAGGLAPLLLSLPANREHHLVSTLAYQYLVTPAGHSNPVIPVVPTSASYFDADRYWRGPVWVNVTWLLIRALERCGQSELARRLTDGVLELIDTSGSSEYFNPLTGEPRGASGFSWTAALALDLTSNAPGSSVIDRG